MCSRGTLNSIITTFSPAIIEPGQLTMHKARIRSLSAYLVVFSPSMDFDWFFEVSEMILGCAE